MSGSVANRAVSVVSLGRMGFMAAYDVQMRYVRSHLDELAGKPHVHGENTLLLVEHTPVFTVGTRTRDYNADYAKSLKQTGAEFYRTNRGGLVTYHGPGQLVVYPILNLLHFNPSMKWYVNRLEETLICTLRRFGITGRRTDQTGVWVDHRKIASIGLHGRRYVTSHGVALNCNTDLTWFQNIEACGLPGVDTTSLSRELDRDVPHQDAIKPFLRSFQEVFDCELEFKMLEEEEFNSVQVPTPDSRSMEPQHELKEVGVRHMSTHTGSQQAHKLYTPAAPSSSSSSLLSLSSPTSSSSSPSSSSLSSAEQELFEVNTDDQGRAEMESWRSARMMW